MPNASPSGYGTVLLVLLFLLPLSAHAQGQGEGTIYSRFGLGELRDFSSSQAQALGGGGYALRSLNYLNLDNPATWSDQALTRFNIGFDYQAIQAENALGEQSYLNEGALNSVQFSFPLITGQLGVAFSLQPYSRSNYRILIENEFVPDPALPDSTLSYAMNLEGAGGLQELRGGFGYRFNEYLSLGANVNAIFGIIESNRRIVFADNAFAESIRTDGLRLNGITGTLGALISVPDLAAEDDLLSLGASFTLPAELSGDRTFTLGRSLDRDTLRVAEGSVTTPIQARIGLSYHLDPRWSFAADGLYAPWSEFSSTFEGAYALPGQARLQDRLRLSAGFEFWPAGEDQTAPYLRRVAYRLGSHFEQTYTPGLSPEATTGTDTPGNAINTYALTGGLSLPTMLPGTRIDVNLTAGTRGTTANDLIRDRFWGFSINVNAGERWFQQRRLR